MKPTVYLETTIIGYLAMRTSRDLRVAANQQSTHEWWTNERLKYELFASQFVVDECQDGDQVAADERLAFLRGIPSLAVNQEVELLAQRVGKAIQIPAKAVLDAFHISIAAAHGIEYLLTWNCKHIANAEFRPKIDRICREAGFEPPVICTPLEMLEIDHA